MTYLVLMLLFALAGVAEDTPAPPEGVITETCPNGSDSNQDCPQPVTSTTTPSELPGPPPARVGGPSAF